MEKALILAGPSAVGKTTVMEKLKELCPKFCLVRSATTRPSRNDGFNDEYIYLSKEEFLSAAKVGNMLEYTEFGGNYYGTPASELSRIIGEGRIPLLILDLNGVRSLKEKQLGLRIVAVYIYEENEVLDSRLYERMKNSGFTEQARVTYEKRKQMNREYCESVKKCKALFDLSLKNIEVETTAEDILCFFNSI